MANQEIGERYDATARWLHWLTVALIIVLVVTGEIGIDAEHPGSRGFFWHSSLGVLVALLAAARIIWALIHPGPALPPMSRSNRLLARTTHVALYLLLFALPASGWLAASAEGARVSVFGVVSLPSWQLPERASPDAEGERESPMAELHETLGNLLLVVAGLHILASLAHQFYWRDGLLERMLPARARTGNRTKARGRSAS
ncbi:MAG: cytochrome b [Proteobacteria bacterium]|nr:cytochrome b [Pseudomonadota bacterium]